MDDQSQAATVMGGGADSMDREGRVGDVQISLRITADMARALDEHVAQQNALNARAGWGSPVRRCDAIRRALSKGLEAMASERETPRPAVAAVAAPAGRTARKSRR
jgi:hypothetical protein